ncbi:unnamed protein product [Cyprideis torosa]|uniref:Midasin n=1 Tax=Cyprideis torosa TaxID=163714 RepID=A0A7R8ZHY8_9CRUS|nr:unnamed protein product [Cyprideis torosa]CAG0883566.1 unnamed protein product [Cyprideis torosa]
MCDLDVVPLSHDPSDLVTSLSSSSPSQRWKATLGLATKLHMTCEDICKFRELYNAVDEPKEISVSYKESETPTDGIRASASEKRQTIFVEGVPLFPAPQNDDISVDEGDGDQLWLPPLRKALRLLALSVRDKVPVLLQGPLGSGKSSLIRHLASKLGQQLLQVQISADADPRALIGAYQCSETPGQFVWIPGILYRAVSEGHWLLLEDVDLGSSDFHSILGSLIERNGLPVPNAPDLLPPHENFRLFGTCRFLSIHDLHPSHSWADVAKLWFKVWVPPPSEKDLRALVSDRWPSLVSISDRLIHIYQRAKEEKFKSKRLISPRDFIKWCLRISQNFVLDSPTCSLKILQDSFDCFCRHDPDAVHRSAMAECFGSQFNVLKVTSVFELNSRKPDLRLTHQELIIGRTRLPISRKRRNGTTRQTRSACFSFTQPSVALLERLAVCVSNREPCLLVGETGVGKTAAVQFLASQLGRRLTVLNMNHQSDSTDLLGGYRPVELRFLMTPLKERFEDLFLSHFPATANKVFLGHIMTCFLQSRWSDLLSLMGHVVRTALPRCEREGEREAWQRLRDELRLMALRVEHSERALPFTFLEGSLITAMREGQWVLLDEVNLAPAETLDSLSSLLDGPGGAIWLLDRGDRAPIRPHSDFRLFAAMNPATDIGKKELNPGFRNRFTELFVDELREPRELRTLAGDYLRNLSCTGAQLEGIVKFYLEVRQLVEAGRIRSGTGTKPLYSLRTLCRALWIASSNPCGSLARSLYEAFALSFLTQLDTESQNLVEELIQKRIVGDRFVKAVLGSKLNPPSWRSGGLDHRKMVVVEGYWIPQGPREIEEQKSYILTPTVRRNLCQLARIVSLSCLPVLLQGDTSLGKTSLIGHLAKATGNVCIRVNNHEHTDIQEYVGCYASDEAGKLVFREGVLVRAMRQGHWVILDELNLAPSEVLEALNRVLDENRELYIPETQERVRAHPNFILFATQNPPGLYGGRKVLSRAFRNRFIELHFGEIPPEELVTILEKRCLLPPTYAKKMVAVMTGLQTRRRISGVFAGKSGFMTLRDLFRWGERYTRAKVTGKQFHDWEAHVAEEGYLVLASRVRIPAEDDTIREVLKQVFKREIDLEKLFDLTPSTSEVTKSVLEGLLHSPALNLPQFKHLVWTYPLRRLVVVTAKALAYQEPVLMVSETGCGKTSVAQLLAAHHGLPLRAINCHMHSESGDFLGGLRPRRNREDTPGQEISGEGLFEWVEGPLVQAMREGSFFLCDEISLADDSVLERLNSVLEPDRKLLLAERGLMSDGSPPEIEAKEGFQFLATMNPGGDFGKKELSPALRNRFTEIWAVPSTGRAEDVALIANRNLPVPLGQHMVQFLGFFKQKHGLRSASSVLVSARDVLAWTSFIRHCSGLPPEHFEGVAPDLSPEVLPKIAQGLGYVHGACLLFLDRLSDKDSADSIYEESFQFLSRQVSEFFEVDLPVWTAKVSDPTMDTGFGIPPFFVAKGPHEVPQSLAFSLSAPTPSVNLLRLLRAMQLSKPVLLEGSPGVGKTSLVLALAKASGNRVYRINLSEQTDISDLFGADLPKEGGRGGEFEWKDGPLLQAIKEGAWLLLDELNLASQSVLEGLNACFDHRGEIFVAELGKTFQVPLGRTRFFACQNPLEEGGGRKGLPQSFLNRFTQVYLSPLHKEDMEFILKAKYGTSLSGTLIERMVQFNLQVQKLARSALGGPWEFNLRDLFRWAEAMISRRDPNDEALLDVDAAVDDVEVLYMARFRQSASKDDRERIFQLFQEIFELPVRRYCGSLSFSTGRVQIGRQQIKRKGLALPEWTEGHHGSQVLLKEVLPELEMIVECVVQEWMVILTGSHASGKTGLVRTLAQLVGVPLRVVSLSPSLDTTELLGGFEQLARSALGGPWEFNLRDLFRWAEAMISRRDSNNEALLDVDAAVDDVEVLYAARFRQSASKDDRERIFQLFQEIFELPVRRYCGSLSFSTDRVQIGRQQIKRKGWPLPEWTEGHHGSQVLLKEVLPELEMVIECVVQEWMVILTGSHASGKTGLVRTLAQLVGVPLRVVSLSPSLDTTELLGGFEQSNRNLELSSRLHSVLASVRALASSLLLARDTDGATIALAALTALDRFSDQDFCSSDSDASLERQKAMASDCLFRLESLSKASQALNQALDSAQALSRFLNDQSEDEGRFVWRDSVLVQKASCHRGVEHGTPGFEVEVRARSDVPS